MNFWAKVMSRQQQGNNVPLQDVPWKAKAPPEDEPEEVWLDRNDPANARDPSAPFVDPFTGREVTPSGDFFVVSSRQSSWDTNAQSNSGSQFDLTAKQRDELAREVAAGGLNVTDVSAARQSAAEIQEAVRQGVWSENASQRMPQRFA